MIETAEASPPTTTVQCRGQETATTITDDARPVLASYSVKKSGSGHHMIGNDIPETPLLHQELRKFSQAQEKAVSFDRLVSQKKCEVDFRDAAGETALQVALELDLIVEANSLVLAGADVTLSDFDEQKLIHAACLDGQTEVVELLLGRITNINGTHINNETPLAAACEMGHLDIIRLLLENGADANISNDDGWTPLHWACWGDQEQIVERLLQVDGLNTNAIEAKMNQTPLNLAVERGYHYIVYLLLGKNADLYIKDSMGWTPLMTATREQDLEMVMMILGHRVGWRDGYLEITDERHLTPLHVASMQGSCRIASGLISAGADCDARFRLGDDNPGRPEYPGYTPLHHACSEDQLQIVDLLLPEVPLPGVEIDARAADQRTPLHVASLVGSERVVKLLLERNADINATDDEGSTPLHLASGYEPGWRKRTAERDLIKPDRDSFDDSESMKRCWESSPRQYVSVIELLMRHGADPTIIDEYGYTALHNAAISAYKGNIEKLLKLMQPDTLSWRDWKQSPIYSALLGEHPLAAMRSLLAKQEVKEAPFWKNGGKLQVIEMSAKMIKPFDILGLLFCELPSEREIVVTGSDNWGPIQWAAHERLPGVLSKLIDDAGRSEDIGMMVHEALQATSKSMTSNELEHELSCEVLVQVMWILITNSQRTPKNVEAVRVASNVVRDGAASQMGATTSHIAEPCDALRRRVSHLRYHNERQNQLIRHDKESSPLKDNSNLKASLHPRDCEPWQKKERRERQFGKEPGVETSKAVKRPTTLGTLQDILKDPPFAQISQTHRDEVDYKPPVPGLNNKRIVQAAEATVVAFFKANGESVRIRRNRPIKEVVYDPGPTDVVGTAIRNLLDMTKRGSMRFDSNLYAKENLKLTWVHLPSTNDLLTKIMSFFRDSWVEVPDKESRSRMMRPRSVIRPKEKPADVQSKEEEATESTTLTETDKDEDGSKGSEATESETILDDSRTEDQRIYDDWDSKPDQLPKKPHKFVPASAIYMPYLSYSTHCRHWDSRLLSHDWDLKQRHDHYEELLNTYKGKDEQQHGSPTLDEWYYQFAQEDNEAINDQSCRNESQIVSKYFRENERAGDMGIEREPSQWTVVKYGLEQVLS
ncbi:ankyrin [Fusarium circinatum]|uniref:Ankyrin n=1 Tax=Fusarium circinatum TaxID=48490 RepID=A0A8H5TA14_FUSCI|nr:ankyrin [Fusarium circinatum]